MARRSSFAIKCQYYGVERRVVLRAGSLYFASAHPRRLPPRAVMSDQGEIEQALLHVAQPGGAASRSESSGLAMGHGIASSGSFQAIAELGLRVVGLACTCTRPAPSRSSPRSRAAARAARRAGGSSRPRAPRRSGGRRSGEPRRTSTATSQISPSIARTSLPCARGCCACRPRSVSRAEREWLSCTKLARRCRPRGTSSA